MPSWIPDGLFGAEPTIQVQQFFGTGHAAWFHAVSQLGTTWGVLAAMGIGLWFWGRREAYALIGIVVLEAAVTLLFNQLVHVPRPDAAAIIKYEQVAVGSFPSGHVLVATVLWGQLYAMGRVRAWLVALVVLAVSVARLYLGVHYLTDIVGGVVIGVAIVWAYHAAWSRYAGYLQRASYATYLGGGMAALAGAVGAMLLGFYGASPFRWHAGGLAAGVVVALLLEYRYVRYQPERDGVRTALAKLALGLLPIVLLAWYDRSTGEDDLRLGALLVACGAIWVLLTAPAIFVGLGLRAERRSPRGANAWRITRNAMYGLSGVVVLLAIYGTAVEPRLVLDVEEQRAAVPGLPPRWVGQRIAVLGDFQVGMWWHNTGMMQRAVERLVEERPAAVLLTGDFIYHTGERAAAEVESIGRILRPLADSRIPTFAVLGNHDWGLATRDDHNRNPEAARALEIALRRLDIRVLRNQAVPLQASEDAEPLYVVGIGSRWAGLDRPREALAGVPRGAARIVLMHHPDSFEEIRAGAAPLAVAGHTHGGQIRIPFMPEWSWLTFTTDDKVHADGWIDGAGSPGNRLYVNRGIGMSTLPIRINCPPELTLFILVAAAVGEAGA